MSQTKAQLVGGVGISTAENLTVNNRVSIGISSPNEALDVSGVIRRTNSGSSGYYFRGYRNNTTSAFYVYDDGTHIQLTNEQAGDLKFHTQNTERVRIDSSGRLLVGTSSGSGNTLIQAQGHVGDTSAEGGMFLRRGLDNANISNGNGLGVINFGGQSGGVGAQIRGVGDAQWGTDDYPGRLVFSTTADGASSPTERMRISNTGFHYLYGNTGVLRINSGAAAGTGTAYLEGYYGATSTLGGTRSFLVYTNGDVANTNNVYGAISDIKLKENIVDANSQWNDLKALQVRNYNFKEGQTHTQIGLIAQEVELVSPGLVSETPDRDEEGNDLGTTTKSVNYSVLYMKAVKALQEAMERIETLEAKVAALEAS